MKVVSGYHHILHIIIAMVGAGFCLGITAPLVEIFLHESHFSDESISSFFFIEALGFLSLAPFVPTLVKRYHHQTLMLVGLLLILCVFLALPWSKGFFTIIVLRFLMGVGKALIFVISASVINLLATENHRGSLIGLFAASFFASEGVSPLFLSIVPYAVEKVSLVVSFLMVLCMLPLVFCKCHIVQFTGAIKLRKAQLVILVPSVIIVSFMQGLNQTAIQEIFSLYAIEIGVKESTIMLLISVILLGGVFLCGFASVLLDKYSYEKVVFLLMVVIIGVYSVLYIEQPYIYQSWLALFFLGGAILSLYIVAMVILGRTYKGINLAGALAGFLIISTISQAFSILFLGWCMEKWGASIFPLFMCAINSFFLIIYIGMLVYKKRLPLLS